MTSWQPFDANLPNVSVRDLEINLEDAKLIAATYGRGIWQTDIPVQLPTDDIKFLSIKSPAADIHCGSTVIPKVEVKNNGLNTISEITINYTIDSTPASLVWNGSLASSAITEINLPSTVLSRGGHTLNVTTLILNDTYSYNNQGSTSFYINDAGTVGVVNSFTNTSDELIVYNEGTNGAQWQRGIRTGDFSSSGNTVYTTNLSRNYPDNIKTYLVSQCYNLTNLINPQISFAMKYDVEPNWDIVYVEYSTNFGASWSILGEMSPNWYNSNRTSATSGTDCYNCPGAQWTGVNTVLSTYTYPLNTLNSEVNIIFRIVFHSDQSINSLGVIIDDFLIDGTLSGQNFELQNIVLYPNPSNGIFNLVTGENSISGIEVYDLTGKIVWAKKNFEISNSEIQLNLSSVSQGVYFIKISTNNQTIVKRIIKE